MKKTSSQQSLNKSALIHPLLRGKDVSFILLIALLAIRILYLGGVRLWTRPDYPDWLISSEMLLTYLLTAILIYLQRAHLPEFHITWLTLILFICAPFLELTTSFLDHYWVLQPYPYSTPFRLSAVIISIALLIFTIIHRQEILPKSDQLGWIAVGFIVGIILAIVYGFSYEFIDFGKLGVKDIVMKPPVTISFVVWKICGSLMNAAVLEEPLFRGFLWGYLKKWGVSDFLF